MRIVPAELGTVARIEADQRAQRYGFARAGFPEQHQGLAAIEREGYAVDGIHGGIARHEADGEIAARRRAGGLQSAFMPPPIPPCCGRSPRSPCGRPPCAPSRCGHRRDCGSTALQTASACGQRVWKRQPDGGLMGLGGSPSERRLALAAVGIVGRHGREQRARVGWRAPAWMASTGADLDHLAQIHDEHAIGDVLHHVQIVADEDVGEAQVALQLAEQIEHLRLHRLVERGHRLVQDDDARIERQGAGDVDALPLPARQLVRIAADEQVRLQPDLGQQMARAFAGFRRRQPMTLGTEGDGLLARQARIEGRVAVLKHHLHLPAHVAHGHGLAVADLVAVENDVAGVGLDEAHEQTRGSGFAAARFADDAERFAALEAEIHAIDGLNLRHGAIEDAAAHREIFAQARDLEDRIPQRSRSRRVGSGAFMRSQPHVHGRPQAIATAG